MFGLESGKGVSKAANYTYEIEKDLLDEKSRSETLARCDRHLAEVKKALQNGVGHESYGSLKDLLQGYTALRKTLNSIIKR